MGEEPGQHHKVEGKGRNYFYKKGGVKWWWTLVVGHRSHCWSSQESFLGRGGNDIEIAVTANFLKTPAQVGSRQMESELQRNMAPRKGYFKIRYKRSWVSSDETYCKERETYCRKEIFKYKVFAWAIR